MPFFSKSKSSKKSSAPAEPSKPKAAPYRHVPTHAASDSMAITSASRLSERTAIQNANRKRISTYNSSQSLAAYASSNSLLRRNSSGFTAASAPANGPMMSMSTSIPKHPGYAAYEMLDGGCSSVPKPNSKKVGKSPLSSPPMSPVDIDTDSDENDSQRSLDLDVPKPHGQNLSSPNATAPPRNRHHSRKGSTTIKLPIRANIVADTSDQAASTAFRTRSSSSASESAHTKPSKFEQAVSVTPIASTSISQKRRSRFSFFGGKAGAIAAH